MKRLIELVLVVLLINSIILPFTFSERCGIKTYGKGELRQGNNGRWCVYVYGPPVFCFNEVYIKNHDIFSDILIPQNNRTEVFYLFKIPGAILLYWGPRNWDFTVIIRYSDYEMFFTLIILLAVSTFILICLTLAYFIINRRKYLIVDKF